MQRSSLTFRFAMSLPILVWLSAAACNDDTTASLADTATLCAAVSNSDVVVSQKADLEQLATRTQIDGDLIVCETTDVDTIELYELTTINGNLVIYANLGLTRVYMPVLTSIGSAHPVERSWYGLLFDQNMSLTTASLPALKTVDQHVWVRGNALLVDFDLPAMTTLTGNITLTGTPMTRIDGFGSLRSTGGSLAFMSNPELESISGFVRLLTISNDIFIDDSAKLTSVVLPTARTVGRNLTVTGSPLVSTVSLPAVTSVGSNVELSATALTSLDGLAAVEIIGGHLEITENATLITASLPALEVVASDLSVDTNITMTGVSMPALTYVAADLAVTGNTLLGTLDVLALAGVGGNLRILDNPVFPNCRAEAIRDQIGTANIGGQVSLSGNDARATCN